MQEKAQDLMPPDPVFGGSLLESLASYDRATSSWRTSQHSLLGGLTEFSDRWPRAGTMRAGTIYRRAPLVPRISETGFGYLPTPDASLGAFKGFSIGTHAMDANSLFLKETVGERPSGTKIGNSLRWCQEFIQEWLRTGGGLNPEWIEVLMGFPIGWTALEDSATPSCRKSQSTSDD